MTSMFGCRGEGSGRGENHMVDAEERAQLSELNYDALFDWPHKGKLIRHSPTELSSEYTWK